MVIDGDNDKNSNKSTKEVLYVSFSDDMISSEVSASQKYQDEAKALKNIVSQEAGYTLIEEFDEFCSSEKIEYFFFSNGLQGVVAYQGFIPDTSFVEIAMTRPQYLKLEKAVENWDKPKKLPFLLSPYHNNKKTIRRLRPQISLRTPPPVYLDTGEPIYTNESIPLYANNVVMISIFDEVSNDRDIEKFHVFRMSIANFFANSITKIKESGQGDEKSPFTKVFSRLLPWRLANNHAWRLAGKYNGKGKDNLRRVLYSLSKSIPRAHLYPLKRLKFGPVSVLCPQNTTTWINEDLDLLKKTIKILQDDALAVMVEIDRICRENKIGYFICGGTMLGYVRHGGFIPWDDDIDIGMLREDYNQFLAVAKEQLSDEFFLQTRESDSLIPYLFSKVRLNNSEYITSYNVDRNFHKGICVDIFPFDKVPVAEKDLRNHMNKVMAKSKAHNKVANNQIPPPAIKEPIRSPSSLIARLIGLLQRRKYWSKSLADTQKQYDEAVTALNDCDKYTSVASFVPTFTMTRLEDLVPYQNVSFENVQLLAPAKPEVFLKMQYGDYFALPPLHQQRGHELLWWSNRDTDSREMY